MEEKINHEAIFRNKRIKMSSIDVDNLPEKGIVRFREIGTNKTYTMKALSFKLAVGMTKMKKIYPVEVFNQAGYYSVDYKNLLEDMRTKGFMYQLNNKEFFVEDLIFDILTIDNKDLIKDKKKKK